MINDGERPAGPADFAASPNDAQLVANIGQSTPSEPEPVVQPELAKAPPPPTVPAGWYPDPENERGFRYGGIPSMRYFDGAGWTEHRAPMQRPQQRQPNSQQPIFVQQNVIAPPYVVNTGGSSLIGLHLVMTIFTCGIWLPFWVLIEIVNAANKK